MLMLCCYCCLILGQCGRKAEPTGCCCVCPMCRDLVQQSPSCPVPAAAPRGQSAVLPAPTSPPPGIGLVQCPCCWAAGRNIWRTNKQWGTARGGGKQTSFLQVVRQREQRKSPKWYLKPRGTSAQGARSRWGVALHLLCEQGVPTCSQPIPLCPPRSRKAQSHDHHHLDWGSLQTCSLIFLPCFVSRGERLGEHADIH